MNRSQRDLCVLFADVSGSTALYERHGSVEALRLVDLCLDCARRSIVACRGTVIKSIGDEVMAIFDSVDDAARAAADLQNGVEQLPAAHGTRLGVHVGFCFGPVIIHDGDVFGDVVNIAARITEIAKSRQILCDTETAKALVIDENKKLREYGNAFVKGSNQEIRMVEFMWQDGAVLTHAFANFSQNATLAEVWLRVRFGDKQVIFGPNRSTAMIGRDPAADLVIQDTRASRIHAWIELRGEAFILIDQSTNGTFVTFENEPEFVIWRKELRLRSRGYLAFGHSATDQPLVVAEFQIVT
jgi:adenylate cyclase